MELTYNLLQIPTNDLEINIDENDKTSVKLNCECVYLYHENCIDYLKINNYTKCPVCKHTNALNFDANNKLNHYIACYTLCSLVLAEFNILFFIFSNVKLYSMIRYCDNKYKMCKYTPVKSILYNNTIQKMYSNNDFDVKYKLISSYKYNIGYENKTCDSLEIH
jgi:hypothetical protein